MKYTLIALGVLLSVFLLVAGCTQGTSQPVATTEVPTPMPTAEAVTATASETAGGSTVPGPTETMPANQAVTVSVEKGGTYSTTIIASFDGGKGMAFVSRCDVKVTRPDGSVVTGTLQPTVGNTVELEGTNGTDRAEVTVYMKSGSVYKIIDQQMPYKTRG